MGIGTPELVQVGFGKVKQKAADIAVSRFGVRREVSVGRRTANVPERIDPTKAAAEAMLHTGEQRGVPATAHEQLVHDLIGAGPDNWEEKLRKPARETTSGAASERRKKADAKMKSIGEPKPQDATRETVDYSRPENLNALYEKYLATPDKLTPAERGVLRGKLEQALYAQGGQIEATLRGYDSANREKALDRILNNRSYREAIASAYDRVLSTPNEDHTTEPETQAREISDEKRQQKKLHDKLEDRKKQKKEVKDKYESKAGRDKEEWDRVRKAEQEDRQDQARRKGLEREAEGLKTIISSGKATDEQRARYSAIQSEVGQITTSSAQRGPDLERYQQIRTELDGLQHDINEIDAKLRELDNKGRKLNKREAKATTAQTEAVDRQVKYQGEVADAFQEVVADATDNWVGQEIARLREPIQQKIDEIHQQEKVSVGDVVSRAIEDRYVKVVYRKDFWGKRVRAYRSVNVDRVMDDYLTLMNGGDNGAEDVVVQVTDALATHPDIQGNPVLEARMKDPDYRRQIQLQVAARILRYKMTDAAGGIGAEDRANLIEMRWGKDLIDQARQGNPTFQQVLFDAGITEATDSAEFRAKAQELARDNRDIHHNPFLEALLGIAAVAALSTAALGEEAGKEGQAAQAA